MCVYIHVHTTTFVTTCELIETAIYVVELPIMRHSLGLVVQVTKVGTVRLYSIS